MHPSKFFKSFILLGMINTIISGEINVILSLQEYFSSKLLLILKKSDDDLPCRVAFDLAKRHNNGTFYGLVTDEKISTKSETYSRFYETLLISFYDVEALVEVLKNFKSYLLASLVWVHFVKNDDDIKELEKVYIPYNCQFIIIKKIEDSYELFEIYKLKQESKLIFIKFGNYENGSYPVLNFYKRRINLNGFKFAMTSSAYSAPIYQQNDIIWNYLERKMNFTSTLVNSKPLVGAVYPNGTSVGVFKLLENGTADVCIGHFVISSERIELYDFIFPTHLMDVRIYISITNHFKWTSYIAPFSRHLWLIIFSWACLASLILFLMKTSSRYFLKEQSSNSVFIILRALFSQSQEIKNAKISFLICLLMPYLITVVIVQAYSGALFSYLAVPDYTPPFQNLRELLDNGNYKIIIQKNGFIWTYFQTDGSEQSEMVRKILLPVNLQPLRFSEGFRDLCLTKNLAFIHVSPVNVTEKCRIIEINNPIFRRPMGIILRNHFPFLKIMNHQLKRVQESGLFGKALKKNQIRQIVDEEGGHKDFTALSFEHILPLFFLLFGGLVLSFIVFLMERKLIKKHVHKEMRILWQRKKRRYQLLKNLIVKLNR